MMRRAVVTSLALGLPAVCGCGASPPPPPAGGLSDAAMESALQRAVAGKDRARALELVNAVLADALGHGYRYGYYSRRDAFAAIEDLKLSEALEPLRQVAALTYEPPAARGPAPPSEEEKTRSYRDLLDVLAITGSLDDLTRLGDPAAPRLNRLQMLAPAQAPLIQSRAIANLRSLKAWDATDDVRRAVRDGEPAPEAILVFTAAAKFLAGSPRAAGEDCPLLARWKSAYRPCFDPASKSTPGISGCDDLRAASGALAARLRCPGP
jgi:hypothetical protein